MAKLNPFRFSTKYQDDETDLLYYGYRYYNASTGRWLSRDPIEEKGGLNLYGFVGNNPISFFDLDGREAGLIYHPDGSITLPRISCPLMCNGKFYNPITSCCCKGNVLKREPVETGVKKCTNLPWNLMNHWWIEFDGGKAYGFNPSGIIPENGNRFWIEGKDKKCTPVKLSPCQFDLSAFSKNLLDMIEKKTYNPDYVFPVSTCLQWMEIVINEAAYKSRGCGGRE
jgi:RHS repeat-associated protein